MPNLTDLGQCLENHMVVEADQYTLNDCDTPLDYDLGRFKNMYPSAYELIEFAIERGHRNFHKLDVFEKNEIVNAMFLDDADFRAECILEHDKELIDILYDYGVDILTRNDEIRVRNMKTHLLRAAESKEEIQNIFDLLLEIPKNLD